MTILRPKLQRILAINAGLLLAITLFALLPPLPTPTPTSSIQPPTPAAPPPSASYNASKLALLIEDRPIAHLAPLLLHMMSVVPPTWPFLFLGSASSLRHLQRSQALTHPVASGRLALARIPPAMGAVAGQESLSRALTSRWFWTWLGGAEHWRWEHPWLPTGRPQLEWVLLFQSDSILCANSAVSLDDWLHYDWVGAPWKPTDTYGGNGGLSLRRVSRLLRVLRTQHRRADSWELEDRWFARRVGALPGARMANASVEGAFSVEALWAREPMGYHLGGSGRVVAPQVWGRRDRREEVWRWCPEIKMIMGMELEGFGNGSGSGSGSARVGVGVGRG